MSARGGWLACVLVAGCSTPTTIRPTPVPAGRPEATIFVTADLRGYLGPCGCSENMRGGISRTAWQLDQARAEGQPVFLVDSGNALFGRASLPDDAVPQQERKARALAQAFKLMKLSVRAHSSLDDTRGGAFRTGLSLPEVADGDAELLGGEALRIGVAAASTPEQLMAAAAKARAAGAELVLGLYHQGLVETSRLGAARTDLGVDLLVVAAADSELAGETSRLLRGEVPVAQVQSKGRSLIRVDVWRGAGPKFTLLRGGPEHDRDLEALDGRIELLRAQVNQPGLGAELKALKEQKLVEVIARRAAVAAEPPPAAAGQKSFAVRFVPIESTLPEQPEVKALMTAYDREVGQLNLAWAKEHGHDCLPAPKGLPEFVGNAPCADCHAEAFPLWNSSKHAHGYATLEQVGKNHHLDCVGCHVTGWQQPGGVCRIDRVEKRQGIGCESCHGPGSIHSNDPTVDNIARGNDPKVCTGCHDTENAPHFNFDTYVSQILGPGHGAKEP